MAASSRHRLDGAPADYSQQYDYGDSGPFVYPLRADTKWVKHRLPSPYTGPDVYTMLSIYRSSGSAEALDLLRPVEKQSLQELATLAIGRAAFFMILLLIAAAFNNLLMLVAILLADVYFLVQFLFRWSLILQDGFRMAQASKLAYSVAEVGD